MRNTVQARFDQSHKSCALAEWGALVQPESSFDWTRITSGRRSSGVGEGVPSAGGGTANIWQRKTSIKQRRALVGESTDPEDAKR